MSYSSTVLADNPTAYWILNELSGTNAADSAVGGSGAGTYEGGFTLGVASLLDTTADTCITLNGTTGDVHLPTDSISLATSTALLSMEAWFKTTTNAAGQRPILAARKSTDGSPLIVFGAVGTAASPYLVVRDNNGLGLINTTLTDVILSDGIRHHIVVTRDASKNWRMYLDGVIIWLQTDTMTNPVSTLDWVYIGRDRTAATFWNGQVDEVAIYKGITLSGDQIMTHYLAGVSESTSSYSDLYAQVILNDSPARYWRLGSASGILAPDFSGNALHGALRNGAVANAAGLIPNSTDAAVSFDGTNDRVDFPTLSPLATSTSECTFEAWVQTSSAVIKAIYGGRQWASTTPVFDISIKANGQVNVQVRGDNNVPSGTTSLSSVKAVNDGLSHYVAVTRDTSKNIRIYIDGALDQGPIADGLTAGITTLDRNDLGAERANATFGPWNGTIDDFAFYPVALSAAQVLNHYTAGAGRFPHRQPAVNHQNPAFL